METKIKNPVSNSAMLEWQLRNVLSELSHVQLHSQDEDCPCSQTELDPPEFCLAKHLLNVSGLASETELMDDPHYEMWATLASEAMAHHKTAKGIHCKGGTWPELPEWSRSWRKKIEPLYYHMCNIKSVKKVKVHDVEEPPKQISKEEIDRIFQLMDTCQRTPAKYQYLVDLFQDGIDEIRFDLSDVAAGKETKLDEVLERLEQGVKSIQESKIFLQFMKTMSRFHTYSTGNIMLIMLQKPDATRVAGFNTWKDLGRFVKQGERGISILAPCWNTKPRKVKVIEKDPGTGEEIEVEKTVYPSAPDHRYFKVVTVFDYSQTGGKELPMVEVPVLTGNATRPLFDRAKQFANSQGIKVEINNNPALPVSASTMGYWYKGGKSIWVRADVEQEQQTKTLLHEIAHAICEMNNSQNAETMAESVAYCAAAHFGFDTGVRSFPYVALWAEDIKVLRTNLEVIRKVTGDMILGIEKVSSKEDNELQELEKALKNVEHKLEKNPYLAMDTIMHDARECGCSVCVDKKGNLSKGPEVCGSASTVEVPLTCSGTDDRVLAILHNHPSGIQRPSEADLIVSQKHNIAVCIKVEGSKLIKCFKTSGS